MSMRGCKPEMVDIAIGHGIESSDSDDMLIIKVSETGWLQWQQEFGTSGRRECQKKQKTYRGSGVSEGLKDRHADC